MEAGVVDHHLHGAGLEQRRDRGARSLAVGDVERDRLGASTGGGDVLHDRFCARAVTVGVDEHVQAVGRQLAADRAAEVAAAAGDQGAARSEEHTSELQSLMRISYAVFCLKKKKKHT